ncbi:hypothetical protein Q8G47_29615, partial [Klebsiella pneumoniae]|uniref:hypothetical protein n=1 Tax=Klebsiella pneumoniae TaxID=573 RepID=UPI003013B9EB
GDEKSRLNVLQLAIELGADYNDVELQELSVHQRGDAASNLFFEANARMRDPVYGCVGAISYLQNKYLSYKCI